MCSLILICLHAALDPCLKVSPMLRNPDDKSAHPFFTLQLVQICATESAPRSMASASRASSMEGSLASTDTDSMMESGAVAGGLWGLSWADADAEADEGEQLKWVRQMGPAC